MKIGIPKALFYYYYLPLWKTFFNELGIDVTFSPHTSKEIINRGVGLAVDEACLPVKAFYGHIDYLKNQVDLIFIPRLVSIAPKEYICPKFMGLPDMIKQKISNLPPVIEPVIDCSKSQAQFKKAFLRIGEELTIPSHNVKMAWQKSVLNYQSFKLKIQHGQKYLDALEKDCLNIFSRKLNANSAIKIGLIGHGYNIYDSGISMHLIDRLECLGIHVVTAENLTDVLIETQVRQLPKKMYWTLGKKALGAAMHWANNMEVNGIIYLSAFGCGPDSLVGDLTERYCRKKDYPILILTVDEHTGEAGMATRIEAFVDLLERRNVS